ncbi:protein D3-like [Sipha flava]|uniref:Protein D3-like n=1 Tax=Sipha flava TaxID=143950 RepID=A0A8B8GPJ2_9HEMI|nr:protein D3-like [Sipha flava]
MFFSGAPSVMSENKVQRSMADVEIVPDVIPIAPEIMLQVEFPSGVKAELGNELTPTQVKDQPTIRWDADPDSFYTLCMTDPDCPSRTESQAREFHHWLVGNIPGSDISHGETLTAFVGSGPPLSTGIHRYTILVYKQPSKLMFNEERINNRTAIRRELFSTNKFALKYNLGTPIAGNFYQAQYDDYVPTVHKQLGIVIDTMLKKLRN